MAAVRKGYVDTPSGQVHYREAGSGEPLILLHQSPSSSRMWEAVLPGLGDAGVRAIALDMPGFGESFVPESEPSMQWYAEAMLAAADGLGLGQFDLLGHHTGASVAMQMAADHPERVRTVLLWGVPLLPPERLERLATEAAPTYSVDGSEVARYLQSRSNMSGPICGVDVHIRSLIEMLQTGDHRPWGHRAVGKTDHEALLARIDQPLYCLAGEREGLLEATRRAATMRPNADFFEMPNAGLDVADEYPSEFVTIITDWLKTRR